MPSDPVLAEVWRGPFLECLHRGALVITDPAGRTVFAAGDVDSFFLPRSSVKPLQAVAMLNAGLDLDGPLLALAGASHDGEAIHTEGARKILDGVGLGVEHLQTTPDLPSGATPRAEWLAAGRGKEPLAHNCSGKHAGMLRTCVKAGWPLDSYRSPAHPLQLAIAAALREATGDDVPEPVVDGCGAPAFAVTLSGLARAFGALASAEGGAARRVADAFRAHPEYASGTARDERVLHQEVPGLVAKAGAEGSLAIGLTDGTGIAVKIGDGHHRATIPAAVAALTALGHGTDKLVALDPEPVLGHGEIVGSVRVAAWLPDALRQALTLSEND